MSGKALKISRLTFTISPRVWFNRVASHVPEGRASVHAVVTNSRENEPLKDKVVTVIVLCDCGVTKIVYRRYKATEIAVSLWDSSLSMHRIGL